MKLNKKALTIWILIISFIIFMVMAFKYDTIGKIYVGFLIFSLLYTILSIFLITVLDISIPPFSKYDTEKEEKNEN